MEKLFAELNRDGGLEKMEVRGEFLVEIKDEKYNKIYIKLKNETPAEQEIQFRVCTKYSHYLFFIFFVKKTDLLLFSLLMSLSLSLSIFSLSHSL
jgi:hypothetical protein